MKQLCCVGLPCQRLRKLFHRLLRGCQGTDVQCKAVHQAFMNHLRGSGKRSSFCFPGDTLHLRDSDTHRALPGSAQCNACLFSNSNSDHNNSHNYCLLRLTINVYVLPHLILITLSMFLFCLKENKPRDVKKHTQCHTANKC